MKQNDKTISIIFFLILLLNLCIVFVLSNLDTRPIVTVTMNGKSIDNLKFDTLYISDYNSKVPLIDSSVIINNDIINNVIINNDEQQFYINKKRYSSIIRDRVLNDSANLILFVEYIKTQSNQYNTTNRLTDIKWVICTMLNRLDKYDVDFSQYYNNRSVNHSNSIKRMRRTSLKGHIDNTVNSKSFSVIHDIVIELFNSNITLNNDSLINTVKDNMPPSNIMYFESFNECPNRGPHLKKNFIKKYRHRFYI